MPDVFNSGIEAPEIQELAAKLAFDVRPCAANWTEAATRAMVVVKEHMPWGAANNPADLVPDWRAMVAVHASTLGVGVPGVFVYHFVIELLRTLESGRRNIKIDEKAAAWGQPDVGSESPSDPVRVQLAETLGYLALQEKAGNCQYQASAVFLVLNAAGVSPVDLIHVYRRDGKPVHGLCVIGIPPGLPDPEHPDPNAWGNTAVLADTWQNEHGEPAASLLRRYPPQQYIFHSIARNAPV